MSPYIVQLTTVVALLPLVFTAGCAASDAKRAARAQLERAETAYRQAQADPSVQAYAQLRLIDAEKALHAAEKAKDSDDKLHLGYLAERKAQLASVTGATAETEQSMQQLRRETAEVLLQKRDRELSAARHETDVKTRDAEQARRAAEARARDAEARARELEQERRQAGEIDAKAAALANELQNLKAQRTDRGVVLTIGDVLFSAGKAEVGPGAQRSVEKLADFLKTVSTAEVLPISLTVLMRAAELWADAHKLGHPINDADLIIAATALESGRPLVTGNTRHYAWITGLALDDWRSP